MQAWDIHFQGHEAPAFLATLDKPLKAVALETECVLFGWFEFSHDGQRPSWGWRRHHPGVVFRTSGRFQTMGNSV